MAAILGVLVELLRNRSRKLSEHGGDDDAFFWREEAYAEDDEQAAEDEGE